MNDGRSGFLAASIPVGPLAGSVLVAGGGKFGAGGDQNLASTELYDPASGSWSRAGAMFLGRYWGPASTSVLPDGSVFVAGGTVCCPYDPLNVAEIFDPVTRTWKVLTGKATTAQGPTVSLADGRVLVAGGNAGPQPDMQAVAAVEIYDARRDDWTPSTSMSLPRSSHSLTRLTSGKVLAAGGVTSGWGVCDFTGTAEVYDLTAAVWSPAGSMTTPRGDHTATLLQNGKVLVTGGLVAPYDCDYEVISSAELYTPLPSDADADGILDGDDNCPALGNPGQEDSDADGVGDACDNCRSVSNSLQDDGDADTVGDACDNCPTAANADQTDVDADGRGDSCDNCPTYANPDQSNRDGDPLGDACDPFPDDADNLGACLDSLDACHADLATCDTNLATALAALAEGHAGLREILRLVSLPPGLRSSTFTCSGELCGETQAVIRALLGPPGQATNNGRK